MPKFQHPLRYKRDLCPDPQLAACCFCGTTTTTFSRKDGAWRAVVRNDVQHGRAANGAVVQLHPLFCAASEAVQVVKLHQCHKASCPGETQATAASSVHVGCNSNEHAAAISAALC